MKSEKIPMSTSQLVTSTPIKSSLQISNRATSSLITFLPMISSLTTTTLITSLQMISIPAAPNLVTSTQETSNPATRYGLVDTMGGTQCRTLLSLVLHVIDLQNKLEPIAGQNPIASHRHSIFEIVSATNVSSTATSSIR